MKKILFAMLMLLPTFSMAEEVDTNPKHDAKYMLGAVPEVNGIVVFSDTMKLGNKNRVDIYQVLSDYVHELVDSGSEAILKRFNFDGLRNRVIQENDYQTFTTIAKVEEILTFAKKALYWDHTCFRYLVKVEVPENGKAIITITQISYYYRFEDNGQDGEIYKAEEWITDKVAVKKDGKKLYPISGKFRRHTIDRIDAIFKGAKAKFKKPKVETEEYEE